MSLNPVTTTEAITRSYLSYLSTVFPLHDPELRVQFNQQLERPERLVKGPILEATPPFVPGATLEALIEEGVLAPGLRQLRSESFPMTRALYRHQEEAIRKAAAGRNVVVATGTGSGKTESFLTPILNHLVRQQAAGRLNAGVRALLVYPLNALANDQMDRLRKILRNNPAITFGRYTGETKTGYGEALTLYRNIFEQDPQPNELISREQMWESPPHILLTNYAMLEYLLLRPDDHVFFGGPHSQAWRFVVLDEVHTYAGAKGIEIAMLLRRLRDRVAEGEPGRLQCIATSATVGSAAAFPQVAQFAARLFGEPFEWVENHRERQDVVGAARLSVRRDDQPWGEPLPALYLRWREIVRQYDPDLGLDQLVTAGRECGVPATVVAQAADSAPRDYGRFLHLVLRGDARLQALQRKLEDGPQYLQAVAEALFRDWANGREALTALVDLAVMARPGPEDQPLIPARYHLFVRTVEGAFLALMPERRLLLDRHEYLEVGGKRWPVFELAVCRQCAAHYLVGVIQQGPDSERLCQGETVGGQQVTPQYFWLSSAAGQAEPDDDELVGSDQEDPGSQGHQFRLCGACGAIGARNQVGPLCRCSQPDYHVLVRTPTADGEVRTCPSCGKRSPGGLVWRFLTGQDATASVLATALYQQLPERRQTAAPPPGRAEDDDGWTTTRHPETGQGLPDSGSRQLLTFSDSRQDAAFFAPYLQRTYDQLLQRSVILRTLVEHRDRVLANRWRVTDLVTPSQRMAERYGLLSGTAEERAREVWRWVLSELLSLDRRNSLEGLGLLGFAVARPERFAAPRPLLQEPWSLNPDEVWTLYQILMDSFRTKAAILFPDTVSPRDEVFAPRNREFYFREGASSRERGIMSWSSMERQAMNARLDFLNRLGRLKAGPNTTAGMRETLRRIWQSLGWDQPHSAWQGMFERVNLPGEGVVFQLKPSAWELIPACLVPEAQWYRCNRCQNLTPLSLRGVCPTYRCDGRLEPCRPHEALSDNHYRRLYEGIEPVALRAEEHTAQLTGTAAFELQQQFIKAHVNVLSCSTTFEMGVDVGDLEAVFMRNMPPSAANYVQRAGRAGRRTESTAFALTFAQRKSHDLAYFQDPMSMVSGTIHPPHLELQNDKIVRRHVNATALSAFFRENPACFGAVSDFFFDHDGPGHFSRFLDLKPPQVLTSLLRVVPPEMQEPLGVAEWHWVPRLYDPGEGPLTRAHAEVTADVRELEEARARRVREGRPSDHILRAINTIKDRYLISFLSSRSVIPKYGFPVDVVELTIPHHSPDAKRLELTRDLRIALAEYAPSSQIVAGGRLWTSRYLRRLPERDWPRYQYAVCPHCQRYQRKQEQTEQELRNCSACNQPLTGRDNFKFLIPEFGFMTETKEPKRPGMQRPERTYTTRTYFAGESKPLGQVRLVLEGVELVGTVAAEGTLAVINHARHQHFQVCNACGYTVLGGERLPRPHQGPWGRECSGRTQRYDLGHEFNTDVLQLAFHGHYSQPSGFWNSLLYALIEGASFALGIERADLDGCLYPITVNPLRQAVILFDDVPGGAGHVRRIASGPAMLRQVLEGAWQRLRQCECGGIEGNASCYGCLRNYRNQFCHDELNRGVATRFLQWVLGNSR